MPRILAGVLSFVLALGFAVASQPPPDGDDRGGPPPHDGKKGGPPPRFQLGNLFPPYLKEDLRLTPEQERAVATLEQEVKRKLEKILTAEQTRRVEAHRPPPPPRPRGDRPKAGPPPQEN